MGAIMLRLPPPVWTVIFLVVAAALSFALGWPKVPGLPFPPLGIALVVIALIPPVWAAGLFRREGTEIDPTSLNLFLRYRYTPSPYTILKDVHKLAPGTKLTIQNGSFPVATASGSGASGDSREKSS